MSLAIAALQVGYARQVVVHDVGAKLAAGTVTALIGPNGSGKSTLLKAVAGLLPHRGTVTLDDRVMGRDRGGAIAYLPQDTGVRAALTVLETVLLGRVRTLGLRLDPALVDDAARTLEGLGLASLADRAVGSLSGGQRQMVLLAQALFRAPRVLLLDEPTAALDLRHQLQVLELVRAQTSARATVTVVALHDLGLAARHADRLMCLSAGRIVAEGAASSVLTEERLRAVYGVEADIVAAREGALGVIPLRAVATGPRPG
ncbi:MAG: ABC transporter ATP-binding protein [Ectothiorhodospiraceae bacterium]|nr:ABC transporter ATP-binding protein [Ectothiorhodospiraceae bacterium]